MGLCWDLEVCYKISSVTIFTSRWNFWCPRFEANNTLTF